MQDLRRIIIVAVPGTSMTLAKKCSRQYDNTFEINV